MNPARPPVFAQPPIRMGESMPASGRMPAGIPRSPASPAFIPVPLSPESRRAPAFTPLSTRFPNNRFRKPQFIRPGFGGTGFGGANFVAFSPAFFGFGFSPFFFGNSFLCDPFSLMFFAGPACFDPFFFNGFSPFFFNSWAGYAPYYDPYSFFSNPYVWDNYGFQQYPAGPDIGYGAPDQSMTPLQSSIYISSGGLPGLTPPPSPETAAAPSEESPAAETPGSAASIDAASRPPSQAQAFGGASAQPGPAETLVFTDGASATVSQCWLGDDWQLHFVTATGETKTIPLDHLNLQATAAANSQRGVTFQLPLSPQPPQQP
ncbi:MAG TPA: hypothetical protein VGS20_11400 [Candidatus Acidoferrales bacterium]|nr:hypothetical protein [Candidatus Acidoferrales bacterium]